MSDSGSLRRSLKALTIGSAMIDTIAVIASERIEQITLRNADTSFLLLEEGRKTDAIEISSHSGGGAINTAVAMARLGHDVSALVKIGRDSRGDAILARLREEKVSTRWVVRDSAAPTGASVIISSHDRNAAIFTHRGANALLEADELQEAVFGVDLVYIASLSDKSADCFPALVDRAHRCGALVATNPGIRQLSTKGSTLVQCLSQVGIIVMNRVEAEAFVTVIRGGGQQFHEEWSTSSLPDQVVRPFVCADGEIISVAAFLATLAFLGPKYVVLTVGRHGALVGTRQGYCYCPAVEQKPAGTAGAGDAFAATFSVSVASGFDCATAIRAAAINAASVVSFTDTQSGLLDHPKLMARLADFADLRVQAWP